MAKSKGTKKLQVRVPLEWEAKIENRKASKGFIQLSDYLRSLIWKDIKGSSKRK